MPSKPRRIVVSGDVTIDWLLLSSAAAGSGAVEFAWMWGGAYPCRILASAGGAASHADILRSALAAAGRKDLEIVGPTVPAEALQSPLHAAFTHTFARIEPFVGRPGSDDPQAWRIAEFMGSAAARCTPPADTALPETIDTLMIVDHAMGYRETIPGLADLLSLKPRNVVWQTGAPLRGSALAETLLGAHADKLSVITSSDELRKAGAQVGYALSWERLAEEITAAVRSQPLAQARQVIVIVGAVGAVIVGREGEDILIFDPHCQESDWQKRYPGVGAAYGRCIDAAVALDLADGGLAPVAAVKRGLAAARAAHIAGLRIDEERGLGANPFPLEEVTRALFARGRRAGRVVYRSAGGASILAQTYGEAALADVAAAVAVHGITSLPFAIPVETVGAWASVDRTEIENLRSVRNIMEEYLQQWLHRGRMRRPLPLAVFGPPGAGKTFAVREMARVLVPGGLRTLEFDLAQLHHEADLYAALHEVRDAALDGDLPLVVGRVRRSAGGRTSGVAAPLPGTDGGWAFPRRGSLPPAGAGHLRLCRWHGRTLCRVCRLRRRACRAGRQEARLRQSPARLHHVMGPNRQSDDDLAWPLRRALLLRSLIAQRAPQMMLPQSGGPQLCIDQGVLHAFLAVAEYIHGARSLEAILEMSSLTGKPRFERASLPAYQQLAMHVDAELFLALSAEEHAEAVCRRLHWRTSRGRQIR